MEGKIVRRWRRKEREGRQSASAPSPPLATRIERESQISCLQALPLGRKDRLDAGATAVDILIKPPACKCWQDVANHRVSVS